MDLATEQLARWGITPAQATEAALFPVDHASDVYREMPDFPAIVIPYFDANGAQVTFKRDGHPVPYARLRLLGEPPKSAWVKRRPLRYLQPKDTPVLPYYWPGAPWSQIMTDATTPLLITEGEAKAIRGCIAGFSVLALGGVYNFTTPSGALIPALADAVWEGRDTYIVYDSDAATNPQVMAAEARLIDHLQRERGARCRIVRLPPGPDGSKVGLDDFINTRGAGALEQLLEGAPLLGALGRKILGLNQHIAWIRREGLVYDLKARLFMTKDNLVSGESYSSLKHWVAGASERSAGKEISVAKEWLTSPGAQRYDEVLFRPGQGTVIQGEDGAQALNLFTGFQATPGDVSPFLRLSEYLFNGLPPSLRDLPIKLMAYKAQHPQTKIPLALLLVGSQGSGKTLWADCIGAAFNPYTFVIPPAALTAQFQGWLETSLILIVNEAAKDDLQKAAEPLKALISDKLRPMNEKFRPQREVETFGQLIITSNTNGSAAFSADDRRMIVVGTPAKREPAFYAPIVKWREGNGPKHLMHYLLHMDLGGWVPSHAPVTAEKHLAWMENLTPIEALAQDMLSGTVHVVPAWIEAALAWAQEAELGKDADDARAARIVAATAQHVQIRPFYTPDEIMLLFPMLRPKRRPGDKGVAPAGLLSRELRDGGVPFLRSVDDPRGFLFNGVRRQYLVVAEQEDWHDPITQADFDRTMANAPTYAEFKRMMK
jgi:hypothetical protein